MYCPKCGKEIEEDSQFCEYCGSRLEIKAQRVHKKGWKVLTAVLVIAIAGTIGGVAFYRQSVKQDTGHKKEALSDILLPTLEEEGKKGYINGSGKLVIERQFEEADEFTKDGLAAVKKDGKWGYIDRNGKTVIDFQCEDIEPFKGGYANVMIGEQWGIINREGETIVDFAYDSIDSFHDGYARVLTETGLYGMVDESGGVIIEPKYKNLGFSFSPHGIVPAFEEESGRWVLLNQTGEMVKAFEAGEYGDVGTFDGNGLAVVRKEGLSGYINENGEIVVPVEYISVDTFYEQKKILVDAGDGVLIIMNLRGEEETRLNVGDTVEWIGGNGKQGIATVRIEEGGNSKTLFLTSEGEILGGDSMSYSDAGIFGDYNLAPVKIGDKWGYINTQNELVIPAIYDGAGIFDINKQKFASVRVDGKLGGINEKGEYVIKPGHYHIYDTRTENIIKTSETLSMPIRILSDINQDENGNWLYTIRTEGNLNSELRYWNIENGKSIGKPVVVTENVDKTEEFDYGELIDLIENLQVSDFGAFTLDELLDTYDGDLSREELDNIVMASEAQMVDCVRYWNPTYVYMLEYPEIFIFEGESGNGDGVTMYTEDGTAELKIWGWYNVSDLTPAYELKEYQAAAQLTPQLTLIDWDSGDDYCAATKEYSDKLYHSMTYYENGKAVSYVMSYPKERHAYYKEFTDYMDEKTKTAFFDN